uniref:NADH-ubiquinone oxidoreductase chain 3 n=1 Tax=Bilobella aurantiaca TaxID=106915 RepID=B5KMC6_BILAU|nr:NADH dehydrogenase subunit 3 [Bilobella aurantiaca]ABS88969.1 NADH dehydrogenase subunit 3 [Bilobella aurantiaca]
MMYMITLAVILTIILFCMNSFLFKKHSFSRNKSYAFECGFDPYSSARTPFSIKFYLISVIFLIFDIEVTLILPIPLITYLSSFGYINTTTILLMSILLIGLLFEWNEGALKWLN